MPCVHEGAFRARAGSGGLGGMLLQSGMDVVAGFQGQFYIVWC